MSVSSEERTQRSIEKTNDMLADVIIMVQNHDIYISDGKKWRIAVIGIVFTMIMQCGGGLYLAGQLTERMENHTKSLVRNEMRLDKNDEKFEMFFRERRNNHGNINNE